MSFCIEVCYDLSRHFTLMLYLVYFTPYLKVILAQFTHLLIDSNIYPKFMKLLIHQMFTEHLPCSRHCSMLWEWKRWTKTLFSLIFKDVRFFTLFLLTLSLFYRCWSEPFAEMVTGSSLVYLLCNILFKNWVFSSLLWSMHFWKYH